MHKLLYFPNTILSKPTQQVENFNSELHDILDNMAIEMINHKGIGLSSNQIGHTVSAFVIKTVKGPIHEFINPEIVDIEGMVIMDEGCLSLPGYFVSISRPECVTVRYQDRNGEFHTIVAEGVEARTIQHEYEHLSGKSFLDNLNRKTRKMIASKLKWMK